MSNFADSSGYVIPEGMLTAALKRLENRSPEETAKKAGILYHPDEALFRVKTMNQILELSFPDYALKQKVEGWHYLLVLHYLDIADGFFCEGQVITFGELKDGLIRGTEFDRYAEKQIGYFLKEKSPDKVWRICEELGGERYPSKADLSVRFWFFPYYPVILHFWFEDDEFLASGKMFLSKSADHFLTVEDAVTVGEIILQKLKQTQVSI